MFLIHNRHQRRKKIRRFLLFIAGSLVILGSMCFLSDFFKIRRVECYTQYGICPEDYYQVFGWMVNQPIFHRSSWSKALSLLNKNPEVKSIKAGYKFPHTAIFTVSLRKPLGQIGSQVLEEYAVADEEGLVIYSTTKSNLPLLLSNQHFSPGDRLSSDQIESIRIISLVNQIDAKIVEGSVMDRQLTINSPPGPVILLDLDKIPSGWYPTLQAILARSKILSNPPKTIDMRFNNPIISF